MTGTTIHFTHVGNPRLVIDEFATMRVELVWGGGTPTHCWSELPAWQVAEALARLETGPAGGLAIWVIEETGARPCYRVRLAPTQPAYRVEWYADGVWTDSALEDGAAFRLRSLACHALRTVVELFPFEEYRVVEVAHDATRRVVHAVSVRRSGIPGGTHNEQHR